MTSLWQIGNISQWTAYDVMRAEKGLKKESLTYFESDVFRCSLTSTEISTRGELRLQKPYGFLGTGTEAPLFCFLFLFCFSGASRPQKPSGLLGMGQRQLAFMVLNVHGGEMAY